MFSGSKAIRDVEHGVKIDFMITGDYPGDGRPKPVAFLSPRAVALHEDPFESSTSRARSSSMIACAITAPHRFRDLDDVVQLIRKNALPQDYAAKLDPYVRQRFAELWTLAQHGEEDY